MRFLTKLFNKKKDETIRCDFPYVEPFPKMPEEKYDKIYNISYVDKKNILVDKIKEKVSCMAVADTHGFLLEQKMKEPFTDYLDGVQVILCLGDIRKDELEFITNEAGCRNIPVVGVKGNHDRKDQFDGLNITDIHLRHMSLFGINFFGFEGSIKYNDSVVGFSQEESRRLLQNEGPCDVFVTHCRPYTQKDDNLGDYNSHAGLIGIKEYIDKNHPVNLCGHNHERNYAGSFNSFSLYGITLITFIPKS